MSTPEEALAELGLTVPDVVPPVDRAAYERELKAMVHALRNTTSIVMWETYNEGQGQYDTPRLVGMVKGLDPTRLVNEASGGGYTNSGDVYDVHSYPPPACPRPSPSRRTSIPCRMRIAERSASSSERGRTSLTYLRSDDNS